MNHRGRLAPTPSGELHLGHAATFLRAQQSIREKGGILVLRIDDVDHLRCRDEFVTSSIESLKAMGLSWDEGPEKGGMYAPYTQGEKSQRYQDVLLRLREKRLVYPCSVSRRQLRERGCKSVHGDILFPAELRDNCEEPMDIWGINWRFRVPDGETVSFFDVELQKKISFTAGADFGDFVAWRCEGMASSDLAAAVDDHDMHITEAIRGGDLLLCTVRQILIHRALDWGIPNYGHCPLLLDEEGVKLSKRRGSISLKSILHEGRDWRAMLRDYGFGSVLE